jgi:HEPN domain-containing protein
MKPAVVRWMEFAEIDLKAAKTLLEEGSLSPVVCFHAQQSVEECLKALIESRGLNPPKSHDLLMLHGQVEDMKIPWRN